MDGYPRRLREIKERRGYTYMEGPHVGGHRRAGHRRQRQVGQTAGGEYGGRTERQVRFLRDLNSAVSSLLQLIARRSPLPQGATQRTS
jgi:hypothetical protein